MPDHICKGCVKDLAAAYRFRMNCESSDIILRSFVTVPPTDSNPAADWYSSSGDEDELVMPSSKETAVNKDSSLDRFLMGISDFVPTHENEDEQPNDDDDESVYDENVHTTTAQQTTANDAGDVDDEECVEEPLQLVYKLEPTTDENSQVSLCPI